MHFKNVTSPAKLQSSVQQHRGITCTSSWKPRVREHTEQMPLALFHPEDNCVVNTGLHCPSRDRDHKKNTTPTSLLCKTSKTLILVNAPLNTSMHFALIHVDENGNW